MKYSILFLFIPLFFASTKISPQEIKTQQTKVKLPNSHNKNNRDSDLEFKRKVDSINQENKKLVKEVNKIIDDYDKNLGYISNNDRKIKSIEQKKTQAKKAVYVKVEDCVRYRTFVGKIFHDSDCKEWAIVDSIQIN